MEKDFEDRERIRWEDDLDLGAILFYAKRAPPTVPNVRPGDLLRVIRKSSFMTQKKFAAKVGWKQSAISKIEKGRRDIGFEVFVKLLKAFNFEPLILARPKIKRQYFKFAHVAMGNYD